MRQLRFSILFFLVGVALVAAGCGGDEDADVSRDSIAVVGDREIAKSEFDTLMNQTKAGFKAQKREFPKVGSPEYQALKNQIVAFLVQRTQFDEKASEFGIEISDDDVDKRLAKLKKQYFQNDEERYQKQLKSSGLTEDSVARSVRDQLVQEKLFARVTRDVKVADKDIEGYYDKNKAQYQVGASREVRHILVPTKKQADSLYDRLQSGESFAGLAKKFSKDPGSAAQGGKLTIARGQTVPAFDKVAFQLTIGKISQPVKTQYGYHIIEPLSGVKPPKTTPLSEVRQSIRSQLLQTKKNEKMTEWVEGVKKEFADETHYQVGFAPPPTATATATTSTGS